MIAKIGLYIFVTGLVIAIFTSNLFISKKEKELAKTYQIQKQSGSNPDIDATHAHLSLLIANLTRSLMLIGASMAIASYLFN